MSAGQLPRGEVSAGLGRGSRRVIPAVRRVPWKEGVAEAFGRAVSPRAAGRVAPRRPNPKFLNRSAQSKRAGAERYPVIPSASGDLVGGSERLRGRKKGEINYSLPKISRSFPSRSHLSRFRVQKLLFPETKPEQRPGGCVSSLLPR